MGSLTNKGKYRLLQGVYRASGVPTNFYIALVTSATAPTVDTNTLSQLTEIAAGNGYTAGGISLSRNSTDFDVLSEEDAKEWAEIQIKDLTWTASGGAIPASGNRARYAVLTDDNVTLGSREVLAFWDLTVEEFAPSGGTIVLNDLKFRFRYTAGWTAKGLYRLLDWYYRGTTAPTNFYIALITNATAPTVAINTFSQLTEIAAGNGYTAGGISLSRNSTDFDVLTEDDANDLGIVQIKDLSWTASGGAIPASGSGASYIIMTDDNATQGSREVLSFWSLAAERSASDGQQIQLLDLTLQSGEI